MSPRHPFLIIGPLALGALGGVGLALLGASRDRKYDEACRRAVLERLAAFPGGLKFRISEAGAGHPLIAALESVPKPRASLSAMLDPPLRVWTALQDMEKLGWVAQGRKKIPERLKIVVLAKGIAPSDLPDGIWRATEFGKARLKTP